MKINLCNYFILIIFVGGVICFNIRDNQLVDYQAKIRELEKAARWEMITKNVASLFESDEIFDKSDAVFFFFFYLQFLSFRCKYPFLDFFYAINCDRKSTTFESPMAHEGEGWGKRGRRWREQILLSHSKCSGSDTKNCCEQDYCSGKTVLAGELLLLKSCLLRLQRNLWPRRMGNGRD